MLSAAESNYQYKFFFEKYNFKMLYEEKLIQYDIEVKKAIDTLFERAFKGQSDPNDLLLVLIHGFYNNEYENITNSHIPKLNPYVFGPGMEGLMHDTQHEFFTTYLKTNLIQGSSDLHRSFLKTQKNWRLAQSVTTQIELMVYLKFWESDFILKLFYNLCRLIHGENYNWHNKLHSSRKNLIEHKIKNKARLKLPKFFQLIEKTYIRQIRNAAAHSQFRVVGDYLNLFNEDPCVNFNLKSITIEQWGNIFHHTILLYNNIFRNLHSYEKIYRESAREKHFGHRIRICKKGGKVDYTWVRLSEPENMNSPWMWYNNFTKYYMRKIHIIIN